MFGEDDHFEMTMINLFWVSYVSFSIGALYS